MKPHHLEETLAKLKLFGMLETLETRLAQATAGDLGHIELLQSLCEDEAARRDATGIERRLKAARFEQTAAIEDFDFSFNPKIPVAQIRDLATLRFVEAGESVILHGPTRTWLILRLSFMDPDHSVQISPKTPAVAGVFGLN